MNRHLALVGPTAAGKSALALAIARCRNDVEIVSLDSMQVYRGMDIGTAKPTPAEQAEVPHHLVDVADPHEDWSVTRTQELANTAIADIEGRGRRALLVGGTGLYVQSVIDAFTVPGNDDDIRDRLVIETNTDEGLADAYERLYELDAPAAARIEPGNRRRIVRALEVIESTGRPFSSFGPGLDTYGAPAIDVRIVGCWLPRAELARRIDLRFTQMAAAGLLDEVAALTTRPGGLSRTAAQAIGYKELLAHLQGECTLDEALALAVSRTRQFARRQRVWFRRDPRIVWMGAARNIEASIDAVLATWEVPSTPVGTSAR
ncbi:MAG: tRNA (adenosine(37)-N6)-dimethylallyltransferase MiaA [Actinomycetota bacterium]|nr:tRNA (adenosine(37)-N6)-dimethylallyltransferase MiaA [Actinomycetota bacterium]